MKKNKTVKQKRKLTPNAVLSARKIYQKKKAKKEKEAEDFWRQQLAQAEYEQRQIIADRGGW